MAGGVKKQEVLKVTDSSMSPEDLEAEIAASASAISGYETVAGKTIETPDKPKPKKKKHNKFQSGGSGGSAISATELQARIERKMADIAFLQEQRPHAETKILDDNFNTFHFQPTFFNIPVDHVCLLWQ